MFLDHFRMTDHPFSERPAADHLLRDERIAHALARLQLLTAQGTFALVLGQTGVGKSSLLRLFAHSLSPHRYQPVYLHLTHVGSSALLRLLVTELGEKPALGKDRLFRQILNKVNAHDRTTLLILDEAHLLPVEALTDLRLLVSAALGDAPPLKIILSGQDALRLTLASDSLSDLAGRISVRCHLHPFSPEQTLAYIDFRLKKVNAPDKLFEPEAKHLIHDYTGGVPRHINNIATACLLSAASQNLHIINEHLVNDTMTEFRLP